MEKEVQGKTPSYRELVGMWANEREVLGQVQPYTARRAAQKALLFADSFGDGDVRCVTSADVTGALVELVQHGGRKGAGLSSTTLRAAHLAGSQAFDWAMVKGMVDANPFASVKRPRERRGRARFLLPAQGSALVAKASEESRACLLSGKLQQASFRIAVCMALATGMRRGEIFALSWADVNPLSLRVSVSKAVKADGSLGEPKSASSVRSVAIGANLMKLLDEACNVQRDLLPKRIDNHATNVICDETGFMANMSTFEHWWRRWIDGLGYAGLRFHDLRHSHATILIASGVDVKTVQTRLGHSSAQITMSIYAHALPQSDGMAAAALDSELFG